MYSYEVSGDYIKVVLRNGVDTAAGIEKMGIVPGLSQISTDKYLEANGIAPGAFEMVSATPTDGPRSSVVATSTVTCCGSRGRPPRCRRAAGTSLPSP